MLDIRAVIDYSIIPRIIGDVLFFAGKEEPILIIRCAKCKSKLFKYHKIGKGKVLRCYKDRIEKDYALYNDEKVCCSCGNVIGIDKIRYIKMKQAFFTCSGTKE